MSENWSLVQYVYRAVLLLTVLACMLLLSSLLAARFAARMLADRPASAETTPIADLRPGQTVELDFYEASGIGREQLAAFLREKQQQGTSDFPVYLTLQNDLGDYLADSRVIVRWKSGQHKLLVGASGMIPFLLQADKLDGLRIIAPRGFHVLKQRTLPFGTAYEPEAEVDDSRWPYDVIWDGFVTGGLNRHLRKFEREGHVVPYQELRRQLRRKRCPVHVAQVPGRPMTATEIHAERVPAVVIVAHAYPGGGTTLASGVVISETGVVATAYHVLDKPSAVSRGVMIRDGRVYPIAEVLAASRSDDIALLRIEAPDLKAAPLSPGDAEGTAVTLISHPGGAYYSLSQGHISRYWATTHYGRLSVKMSVTAPFADGSSGGPLFNSRGEVTGLVSATTPSGGQMVSRIVAPVAAIRDLIGPAEVGPVEVGLGEVGPAEVGPAEVGPAEVGLGEIGQGEIGLGSGDPRS